MCVNDYIPIRFCTAYSYTKQKDVPLQRYVLLLGSNIIDCAFTSFLSTFPASQSFPFAVAAYARIVQSFYQWD